MTLEDKILTQAGKIRGEFINHVAFIEKQIELYIAYHFCKDYERAYEMIEIMLGYRYVSFESKRGTFESILKRHHPEIHSANSDKLEYLTIIQNQRNKLAHLMTYLGEEAEERFVKDGSIAVVKFVFNKTQPVWFDDAELRNINTAVNSVKDWIPSLLNNENPS